MLYIQSLEDHTHTLRNKIVTKKQWPYHLIWGTGLSLQINHRKSIDLDFVTYKPITAQDRKKILWLSKDYQITLDTNEQLDCFIDGVKVTLLSYWRQPMYELNQESPISIRDIKDIAISKAHTIGRRSEIKDYIDLYWIISKWYYSLEDIVRDAQLKFAWDFSAKLFLQQLLLCSQCERYDIYFIDEKVSHQELIQFFDNLVANYLK
jgi:hypothetical protein